MISGGTWDGVVRRKAAAPGDDLLGRLITGHVCTGACSLDTAVDLARMLFVAGHGTTVNMIGIGLLTLLLHSDQLQRLRDDPELIVPALNELLRYLSITATLSRLATTHIAI